MRRIKFLSVFVLLVLAVTAGSGMVMGQEPLPEGSSTATTQQPPPIPIQVDGKTVFLEPNKNVHPQTYTLLSQDPDFASQVDWVFMEGMWIPLSRGVEMLLEKTLSEEPPPPGPEYIPECKITLNVPVYGQCTSPWGSHRLFDNPSCDTMCNAGCAITSVTMVFKYFGASKNPGQVNTCCGNNGCRSGCDLTWACAANSCSDGKARWVNGYSFYWGALCGLLTQDRPPIVGLVKESNRWHFVVVYKSLGYSITDPNGYYINDPADGSTYKKLSAYTNNGWTPSVVKEYARK